MSYFQSSGHFGTRTCDGHSAFSLEKRPPTGASEALYFVLLEMVAGVRNLPIAPTIRFEFRLWKLPLSLNSSSLG